jgi:hypothetical protein
MIKRACMVKPAQTGKTCKDAAFRLAMVATS